MSCSPGNVHLHGKRRQKGGTWEGTLAALDSMCLRPWLFKCLGRLSIHSREILSLAENLPDFVCLQLVFGVKVRLTWGDCRKITKTIAK